MDWHLGQWRLRQVMVSSPLPALWGVNFYGELNAADITLLHVASQGGGATVLDGLHDPAVRKG